MPGRSLSLGGIPAAEGGTCSVASRGRSVPAAPDGVGTSGLPGRQSGNRLLHRRHSTGTRPATPPAAAPRPVDGFTLRVTSNTGDSGIDFRVAEDA